MKETEYLEIHNDLVDIIHAAFNDWDDYCEECYESHQSPVEEVEDYVADAVISAGYRKIPDNIGEFSDGYHTFNELYHHRAVLFSVICNMFPEKAWKSKLHDIGDMYDGMFIVGIETDQGQATYHYDIDPYWDMFNVRELERAPKWDGHTPSVAIERIGKMSVKGYRKQREGEWKLGKSGCMYFCSECNYAAHPREAEKWNCCPNCETHMRKEDEGK